MLDDMSCLTYCQAHRIRALSEDNNNVPRLLSFQGGFHVCSHLALCFAKHSLHFTYVRQKTALRAARVPHPSLLDRGENGSPER